MNFQRLFLSSLGKASHLLGWLALVLSCASATAQPSRAIIWPQPLLHLTGITIDPVIDSSNCLYPVTIYTQSQGCYRLYRNYSNSTQVLVQTGTLDAGVNTVWIDFSDSCLRPTGINGGLLSSNERRGFYFFGVFSLEVSVPAQIMYTDAFGFIPPMNATINETQKEWLIRDFFDDIADSVYSDRRKVLHTSSAEQPLQIQICDSFVKPKDRTIPCDTPGYSCYPRQVDPYTISRVFTGCFRAHSMITSGAPLFVMTGGVTTGWKKGKVPDSFYI
jgi:hypothetical protein